jgi:hypothetical protein
MLLFLLKWKRMSQVVLVYMVHFASYLNFTLLQLLKDTFCIPCLITPGQVCLYVFKIPSSLKVTLIARCVAFDIGFINIRSIVYISNPFAGVLAIFPSTGVVKFTVISAGSELPAAFKL